MTRDLEKRTGGRWHLPIARAGRILAVAAGVGALLVLASLLDPRHDEQVARDEAAAVAREAHEAKLAALGKAAEIKATQKRLGLDFTKLGFQPAREVVDAKTGQPRYLDQAPEAIKAYDGRPVHIRGYLLPVHMDGNEVRDFLIIANQMTCCYGRQPRFWEFIAAHKTGDAVPNLMDTPLTFEGVLKVGDVYENGYWTQFYTLECTNVMK
jgi:hypothetical protein